MILFGFYHALLQNCVQKIAAFLPQGVVCVESALFHYGYSDFAPRQWAIAIPRSFSRIIKQMQEVPVKAYYIQEKYCDLGRTTDEFNGVMLPVYDRERTICDCFKYRTKLDNELFNKALNAYVSDDKKNLSDLSKYAKKMRVYTKLMSVIEVLRTIKEFLAEPISASIINDQFEKSWSANDNRWTQR